jgi:excisionase family DNA binding protein
MSTGRLATIAEIAAMLSVTERSVRTYISKGFFPAYRIPGTRGVRLDPAEVKAKMKLVPTTVARPGAGSFGPNAKIIDLPPQPRPIEVIDEIADLPSLSNQDSPTA